MKQTSPTYSTVCAVDMTHSLELLILWPSSPRENPLQVTQKKENIKSPTMKEPLMEIMLYYTVLILKHFYCYV